jgi:DNA topoisomerase-1
MKVMAGRFGPYVQLGEGDKPKRSSLPKGWPPASIDIDRALRLLNLPREVGKHPESGKEITASIGRYGPYLAHDGKYAKLRSTTEVFETGMNAAVSLLAEAANRGPGARATAEPIAVLGAHPVSGGEMKVMAGRFGPYVTDGTTNATLPRDQKPEELTAAQAVTLIDEKAAKGPAKGKKKAAPKKAAAKKPAAKKAPAKKTPAKKAATKAAVAVDEVLDDEVPF